VRILLTGVAGFLGCNFATRLVADGHTVIGADNLITGRRVNLAQLETNPLFTWVEQDVIQPLEVAGALDWVLHLASPASPPKYLENPLATLRVNSEGTLHLLELAQQKKAKFLIASTSEIYGDPDKAHHPQQESYWGNVNPLGARSVYDEAKRFAEAATALYGRNGLSVRIPRLFNTYGPHMDPADGRIVTNFITQALSGEPMTLYGSGNQTRSLQYVDDLIEGFLKLMASNYAGPVNLGNPEEYTVRQIAELIRELTGSQSPLVYRPLPEDDPTQRKPDISLARRLLGWEPIVPAREGLARTVAHFRATR
jgi:nucleoside-diphosphate-sugar epimerase